MSRYAERRMPSDRDLEELREQILLFNRRRLVQAIVAAAFAFVFFGLGVGASARPLAFLYGFASGLAMLAAAMQIKARVR